MDEETKAYIAAWERFIADNDIPLETDHFGQVVIYTGLMLNDQNELVPFEDDGNGYAAK